MIVICILFLKMVFLDATLFSVESLDQGLFCHNQVSSDKFLEFLNLWRNIQMFLDTMEPRTEKKTLSLEKTVLIMWAQMCGIIA